MYTDRPSGRSRSQREILNSQKQIDNLIAVGLLDREPRSHVKKKRNVEFKEISTKLQQPITSLFVVLPS